MTHSPTSSDPNSEQPQGEPRVVSHKTALQVRFQGPLPPPAILEHYDRIVPGAAARILVMAENQSKHRQVLERRVINTGSVT